ncbi:ATP-binding cassette sub-family G member 1-like isoform X2 [Uranotaenia lowii]|nr:ATP-binding cassette sub-family G member 1-like isoform X2 [Uranotaenia lowii]
MVQANFSEVIVPLKSIIESNGTTGGGTSTCLRFENLNYTVRHNTVSKCLLHNVSGTFRSGRLAAIVGPSGAGKSSLMNVLSGFRISGVTGKILINEEQVDRRRYRRLVAYNEQDADLLPNITVRETLVYTADLKMPSRVPRIKKIQMVNEIIALLGLQNCSENQTRVLSGGERKRLSIGQELVSNPKIMFFDEPTSGLDSESSYQVISFLRQLSRQDRCVISVIHQPSSDLLELFDDIYVVTGGRCLYQGSLADMIPTFADEGLICPQYYNRADFAIKMASKTNPEKEKIQKLMKRMETASLTHDSNTLQSGHTMVVEQKNVSQYAISQWKQFSILTHRTLLGTLRNFTLMVLRFIGHIMVGLIFGLVYFNVGNDGAKVITNIAYFMASLLFSVFANSMTVVLTFPMEMAVFIREYKGNSYSTTAYFFSKIVADFPSMLGGITLFQLIAYFMSDQPDDFMRILMFWFMSFTMAWFAQVYGMLCGSIFPIEVSPFLVIVTLIPCILFSGFFIRYDELSVLFQPLTYLSPFRYTFEGMSLAIYGNNRTDLACDEMFCYYRKSKRVLEMLDMEKSEFWTDVLGMLIIIVTLHVALYVSLRCKVRR